MDCTNDLVYTTPCSIALGIAKKAAKNETNQAVYDKEFMNYNTRVDSMVWVSAN